jgi:predicted CopG family antitoxin
MKTIMVSDESYNKLLSIKGTKSFTELLSEIVDRLKSDKMSDIDGFFGMMKDSEAEELREFVKRTRGSAKVRL